MPLLHCLVCFFWVWNKITEVRVGLESQKYLKWKGFWFLFLPTLWQWQSADKIWELDEMKQHIRVPCHLGRWWLKMASLTLRREDCLGRPWPWMCKGARLEGWAEDWCGSWSLWEQHSLRSRKNASSNGWSWSKRVWEAKQAKAGRRHWTKNLGAIKAEILEHVNFFFF